MISDIITTNWYELGIVAARAFFSLVALFLITKIIGKKQISQLSLFDYVIGISIGNFSAEMTMNLDSQVLSGLISIIIYGLVAALVSILTMKSIVVRRFFMGTPTLIMQDGKFIYKNLKRIKYDINDFLEAARVAGYFDISEIKYALMEANGKISFLPKEENQLATNKDLNIKIENKGLCANVIIDGKLMDKNLFIVSKDKNWLDKELKKKGYDSYQDILLATIDINNKLVVFDKNENDKIKNVLE